MKPKLGSLESLVGLPLQQALDNTGVGLAACDRDGRLTLISPTLQELFGVTFEPVAEQFYVELFQLMRADGETPLSLHEVPLVRARHGEFVRDEVISTRHSDGSLLFLRCNAMPLFDSRGRNDGAIALVQDVTAESMAALRAEQMRRRLLETINHEFRTPLAALLSHIELIHDHRDQLGALDADMARWLDAIERSGWRLRDLVEEVTELVRNREAAADSDPPSPRMRVV